MKFFRTWTMAFIGSVAVVALFNAVTDPYLLLDMPRFQGFNARKPAADTKQRLMKVYDVFRTRPKTLILGSSRAALGMDARSTAWAEQNRPVYNLAFGEGSPYMAYRYLQHVLSRQGVSTVVLGLEFEYFLRNFHIQDHEFESHLLVAPDGSPRESAWGQLRDVSHGLTGLNSLSDSIDTMTQNWLRDSSDMRSGNWYWSAMSGTQSAWGARAQFTVSDILVAPLYGGYQLDASAFDAVDAFLDLCESHHIRVIIFISPSHADQLEIINLAGEWPVFEQWMRNLTALVSRHAHVENHEDWAVLWDFTGYYSYTDETLLGHQWKLKWFVDPDHYSKELGDLIIRRLLHADESQFGEVLTSKNIESHVRTLGRQRQLYLQEQPADALRIRELYELATVGNFRPVHDIADR